MESCDPEANVIFGASIKEDLGDEIMITVIATGFEGLQNGALDLDTKPKSSIRSSLNTTVKQAVKEIEEEVIAEEKIEPPKKASIIEEDDDESMEIPTFLRRRR